MDTWPLQGKDNWARLCNHYSTLPMWQNGNLVHMLKNQCWLTSFKMWLDKMFWGLWLVILVMQHSDHVATVRLSAPNRHHLRYTQFRVVNYQIQMNRAFVWNCAIYLVCVVLELKIIIPQSFADWDVILFGDKFIYSTVNISFASLGNLYVKI